MLDFYRIFDDRYPYWVDSHEDIDNISFEDVLYQCSIQREHQYTILDFDKKRFHYWLRPNSQKSQPMFGLSQTEKVLMKIDNYMNLQHVVALSLETKPGGHWHIDAAQYSDQHEAFCEHGAKRFWTKSNGWWTSTRKKTGCFHIQQAPFFPIRPSLHRHVPSRHSAFCTQFSVAAHASPS